MEKIKSCNRSKFNIPAPTWNDEFELPDESYFMPDIQDYIEYIIKKHEMLTDNPPIQICINRIKNRISFKIKTGYYIELLTP